MFSFYQVFEAASPVFLEIILLGSVFMHTSVSVSKFLFIYTASLAIQVSGSSYLITIYRLIGPHENLILNKSNGQITKVRRYSPVSK